VIAAAGIDTVIISPNCKPVIGEIVIKQQSESETDPGGAAAKRSDHAWQG
jgi:hypothetical protein